MRPEVRFVHSILKNVGKGLGSLCLPRQHMPLDHGRGGVQVDCREASI